MVRPKGETLPPPYLSLPPSDTLLEVVANSFYHRFQTDFRYIQMDSVTVSKVWITNKFMARIKKHIKIAVFLA